MNLPGYPLLEKAPSRLHCKIGMMNVRIAELSVGSVIGAFWRPSLLGSSVSKGFPRGSFRWRQEALWPQKRQALAADFRARSTQVRFRHTHMSCSRIKGDTRSLHDIVSA